MKAERNARRAQRGLSLIEVSLAMIVMGLGAMVLWQSAGGALIREGHDEARFNLDRAKTAVLSFVAIHGRFPCPAAQQNGQENCGAAGSFFPHLTVGVPEADAARLSYQVNGAVAPAGAGDFRVLMNNMPINLESAPLAVSTSLSAIQTGVNDGMLDLCEALGQISDPANASGGGVAFSININPGDRLISDAWNPPERTRTGSAAEVSDYLACGPLVAVAGRAQFNAHLSAGIMNRALQDYRLQHQIGYGTYVWDLAEGVWSLANGMYASLVGWAKVPQAASALAANLYTNPTPHVANLAQGVASQIVALASIAAKISNVMRFVNNLGNFHEHLKYTNFLVNEAQAIYSRATEHAIRGSSSAYFLNAQGTAAADYPRPAPAPVESPIAEGLLLGAQQRASGFDYGGMFGDLATLTTEVEDLSLRSGGPRDTQTALDGNEAMRRVLDQERLDFAREVAKAEAKANLTVEQRPQAQQGPQEPTP
ncbi:type II secretion system protein [Hydrogenophaga sp.]|uniref:type II secretion system protein n=1 Tax=Hydrogenophaga sp. TaxID=1904254 RepID=UPI003F6F13A0